MELRPVAEVADLANSVYAQVVAELSVLIPLGARPEHVGATALLEGVTKGDLDVAISVPQEEFVGLVDTLREHYEVAQPQNWTATFASFSLTGKPLPVGIQVAVSGSEDDFLVALRELMRSRPDVLAGYTECKLRAASRTDVEYWNAKDQFLRAVFIQYLPWARPATSDAD